MTVVEFLTARLDAEEGDADRVHDIDCYIHPGFADERGDCTCAEPARVLAQVAAMRAIVELAERLDHESDKSDGLADLAAKVAAAATARDAVRHLAAIWSDHEAYDPAWHWTPERKEQPHRP